MKKQELPENFIQQMEGILPQEHEDFFNALNQQHIVSIQLNAAKPLATFDSMQTVKWYEKGGRYLNKRPIFTLDPLLHAGGYYVQEASSMLIGAVIQQLEEEKKSLRALDLCAAPGGKSLLLSNLLSDQSLIVCNEVIRSRASILRENLIKRGKNNTIVSNFDANAIAKALPNYFDLVIVDAPCSGEGLFRKNPEAIEEWSLEHVKHCSLRQRRILADAYSCLATGGLLIYSTCTYNDEEDRHNADWLASNFDLTPIRLTLQKDWGISERQFARSYGYFCFPHRVKGEGFFLSIFRKPGSSPSWPQPSKKQRSFRKLSPLPKKDWSELNRWIQPIDAFNWYLSPAGQVIGVPVHLEAQYRILDQTLPGVQFGLLAGSFKRKNFVPAPELALNTALSKEVLSIELTKEEALSFLRKEPFHLPNAPKGWILARYQGLGLGWMKIMPNRINNYWPTQWRIRM